MIIDCFLLFQELDLLAFRLEFLSAVVDKFLIVEADQTFSGKAKRFLVRDAIRAGHPTFQAFASRIEYVKVADMPNGSAWEREAHQRAAIERGLSRMNLSPSDWVLISDVDELPDPARIMDVVKDGNPRLHMMEHTLSYYYVNCVSDRKWHGTRMLQYRSYTNAQILRHTHGVSVSQGGWHWSYLGGIEAIRQKLEAYAHQEYNTAAIKDAAHLQECLAGAIDLFSRADHRYTVEDITPSYPLLLRSRLPYYTQLGWVYTHVEKVTGGKLVDYRRSACASCDGTRSITNESVRCRFTRSEIIFETGTCPLDRWGASLQLR